MKKNKKTINTIKLVIVVLMAVAIAFSALAPIFGAETALLTRDEIKEEVASFVKDVQEITKEVAETPRTVTVTNTVRGVPGGFAFRNELRERTAGDAVRYLQIALNVDPKTRVAESGPGSPGRETNYFGPATRRAVIKFQQKYNLSATGIVDSATRAKVNEILQKGVTVREEATEKMNEIRLRVMNMLQTLHTLRERMRALQREEERDCMQDIEDAKEHAEELICTMETREMSCGETTYLALNGCEIEFLIEKGWE
jgi:hypothetical protein